MLSSGEEEGGHFGLDSPQGLQVIALLGAFHALGGQDAAVDIFPKELRNEGAGDAIVGPLFVLGVDLIILGAHAVELPESILIDVVVHLAADQLLEEIISFEPYATFRGNIISFQQGLHHALRLLLLLDVGEDEPDDVGHHVAVLHLLRLLTLLL